MAGVHRGPVGQLTIVGAWGDWKVSFTRHGLCGLRLPTRGRRGRRDEMRAPRDKPAWVTKLSQQLRLYEKGAPVVFDVPVDFSAGTVFQQKVWRALRRIPHGQTSTYRAVAMAIGQQRAARAVGAACGANPLPVIVPCHRVVASNGGWGGFSGGLRWKMKLLAVERTLPRFIATSRSITTSSVRR